MSDENIEKTEIPDYSIDNPPKSCMECYWHTLTYIPSKFVRSLHYDSCGLLQKYFSELHIILLGEFRTLSKHDEDDLSKHLPYECPFFDSSHLFWELYGIIHMQVKTFVYECLNHFGDYQNYYVYSLPVNIDYLSRELPPTLGLHYIYVSNRDHDWFMANYGATEVLISKTSPDDWHYIPPKPI